MPDFRIEGVVDLDVRKAIRGMQDFRKQLVMAGQEIGHLSKDIDRINAKNIDVAVDVDMQKAIDEIEVIKAEMDTIRDEKATVEVDVDGAAKAVAEVEVVKKQVESLDGKKARINIDVDSLKKNLKSVTSTIAAATTALGGAGRGGLIAGLVVLSTVLLPMIPVFAGWGAGVAGAMAVAAGGVGSFVAFAIPAFKEIQSTMKELDAAQKAVNSAKTVEDRNKALAAQKKLIESIPAPLSALIAKWKEFNTQYQKLAKNLSPRIWGIVSSGIDLLWSALQLAYPVAVSVTGALERLMVKANAGIKGDSWVKFFDYLSKTAGPMIDLLGTAFGNLLTGVANVIVALDPLTQSFAGGFSEMSANFLRWSQTLETNKGFQDFVSYVQTEGPKVWAGIKGIVSILWNLGKALAPIGERILSFAAGVENTVSAFLKANPQVAQFGLLAGALGAVLAPVAVALAGPLSQGLWAITKIIGGGLLGMLTKFGGFLKTLGLSAAIAGGGVEGMAGPLMGLGTVMAALGGPLGVFLLVLTGIGVALAFAHTSGAKFGPMMASLGKSFDVVKTVAANVWNTLKGLWELLKQTGTIAAFQEGITSLSNAFQQILPIVGPVVQILGVALVAALWIVGQAFKTVAAVISVAATVIGFVIKAVVAVFQWLFDVLVGHSIIPDLVNAIGSWFSKMVGLVMGPVNAVRAAVVAAWNFIKGAVSSAVSAVKSAVSGAWNSVRSISSSAWSSIKSVVNSAISTVKSTVSSGVNTAKSALSSAWNTMKSLTSSAFNSMKSAVSNAISNIKRTLGGIRSAATGALSGASGWLIGAGRNIIGGLLSGINSMIGNVKSKLGQLTSLIPDWKGPKSVDEKLLSDNGHVIMQSLIDGLAGQEGNLRKQLSGITKMIPSAVGMDVNLSGAANAVANRGSQQSSGNNKYIGMYLESGAIKVEAKNGNDLEQRLTNVLTRVSRFGQFQGPVGSNA